MDGANLFTMLSAYRPGAASPFEDYCTNGLAYLLGTGNEALATLFRKAAGTQGAVADVTVQPGPDAPLADLGVTFADGREALVEIEVAPGETVERPRSEGPRLRVAFDGGADGAVTWNAIADALADDADRLAREFAEFVRRDVLGLEAVGLDDALHTNRLYALGGAALRDRFGEGVRYENSSSTPVQGRYRYLGTTFSPDGGELRYWIGLVNESLPLSEHYHLMLASKTSPLQEPAGQPRATGNWRWEYWSGMGRVVRPVGLAEYGSLLGRMGT
ncbi:MAG: hypothetical protein F4Z77_00045 [Dehalococcoidia bacterium]|nr:hypothetical protein [Dehalococcoidia bacterium]MYA54613.1 hypothetical protein [Dehalococcoidia bacterium]